MRDGQVIELDEASGLPLGILVEQSYDQATVQLERGDLLLFYTDGITEAAPPVRGQESRELFGVKRLDELLVDCADNNAPRCIERVRAAVNEFSGNGMPADDQTLIAMRCL